MDSSPWRLLDTPLFVIGGATLTPGKLALGCGLLATLWAATRAAERLLTRRARIGGKVDPGVLAAMTTIGRYVVLAVGTLAVFQTLGIDLSSVMVVAGTLGIGVGLALQPLLSNFVGGLVLLLDRSIKVGDRVEIGGLLGDVQHISARATTILTFDNISVIVPNAELISSRIVNWSHADRRVRYRVPVGVAYGSDPERVRAVLLDVARTHPGVLADPPPDVILDSFGDSALLFELRVWTDDCQRLPAQFRSDLNFRVLPAFEAHGIEIPFPQRVVHLRDERKGTA